MPGPRSLAPLLGSSELRPVAGRRCRPRMSAAQQAEGGLAQLQPPTLLDLPPDLQANILLRLDWRQRSQTLPLVSKALSAASTALWDVVELSQGRTEGLKCRKNFRGFLVSTAALGHRTRRLRVLNPSPPHEFTDEADPRVPFSLCDLLGSFPRVQTLAVEVQGWPGLLGALPKFSGTLVDLVLTRLHVCEIHVLIASCSQLPHLTRLGLRSDHGYGEQPELGDIVRLTGLRQLSLACLQPVLGGCDLPEGLSDLARLQDMHVGIRGAVWPAALPPRLTHLSTHAWAAMGLCALEGSPLRRLALLNLPRFNHSACSPQALTALTCLNVVCDRQHGPLVLTDHCAPIQLPLLRELRLTCCDSFCSVLAWGSLARLTYLLCRCSRLELAGVQARQCGSLTRCWLQSMDRAIPASCIAGSLVTLKLSGVHLQALPAALLDVPHLQGLALEGCIGLTRGLTVDRTLGFLEGLTSLRWLYFPLPPGSGSQLLYQRASVREAFLEDCRQRLLEKLPHLRRELCCICLQGVDDQCRDALGGGSELRRALADAVLA